MQISKEKVTNPSLEGVNEGVEAEGQVPPSKL